MADQPQRSVSRQQSLRTHPSFPASQRSSAPPASAQQQPSKAAAEAATKAADDKATEANDDMPHKKDKEKQGQAGVSADSQGGSQGGAPQSQVPQSPFGEWRAEEKDENSTQTDATEVRAYGLRFTHAFIVPLCGHAWKVLCCTVVCAWQLCLSVLLSLQHHGLLIGIAYACRYVCMLLLSYHHYICYIMA